MIPKEDGSWSFLADYFENDKSSSDYLILP